ncbi:MAG: DUF5117 domain-containing protein [Flavobacteriaceae bacterium]|nr:DUF5117 domain-containing protein [Flavobacteriaceae bacterium]
MRIISLSLFILLICISCASKQSLIQQDVVTAKTGKTGGIPSIEDLLGKDAEFSEGLFNIYQKAGEIYFEIPDSLLNREMLVVTRFIKTPAGAKNYGGEEIGDKTIYWEKGPSDQLFLRIATLVSVADEEEAIASAVNNATVTPILEAFDIKARNEKAGSSLIRVDEFINSDNPLLTMSPSQKDAYKLSTLEDDKSYVKNISSFPINTEIRSVKTYKARSGDSRKELPAIALSGVVTLEINNSLILLPKEPMKKRAYDPRVGYFASSYLEYGDEQQKVAENVYIHRWRLEPREEDRERWLSGELVTPKEPIVFYLDPATPKKWRPYLIQGINDWQKAFEKAGFKDAIVGKEWPENNKDMSLEDSRFSVLRYFASPSRNAYGPNITDPRSGEILESHIGWYHNVLSLVHDWYMIQAGAVDPGARKMEFDTELMGQLIRFVCSHEVGHTLGLRHNMAASFATPVEKLRDAEWQKKYGHTSSIMDYARFNYVAQPQDSIAREDLMPRINDYDLWAIQWGYGPLPKNPGGMDEKELLNAMVVDSISNNPRLWFGGEGRDFDPRSQREDLGDQAVIASNYGILNLQRIVPHLPEWTRVKRSDSYRNLDQVYTALVKQYDNYLFHVVKNIGGIYETPKTMGETGEVYAPVDEQLQREALLFLDHHIFHEPKWLLTNEILNNIQSPQSKEAVTRTMESVMLNLLGGSRLSRMTFISERFQDRNTYTPEEYMDDLYEMTWGDLNVFYQASTYRRKLQKAYVENLIALYRPDKAKGAIGGLLAKLSEDYTSNTDVRSLALSYLLQLQKDIKSNLTVINHRMTRAHLQYLEKELAEVIGEAKEGQRFIAPYNPDMSIKAEEGR